MSYEIEVVETPENGWAWRLLREDGLPVQGGMGYDSEQAAREAAFVPHESHPEDTELSGSDELPKGHPWATN